MRRLLSSRPSAFLLRAAILAIPLLVGSGANIASAYTECFFVACETLSDGSKICVSKPIPCPPTNT
jgi:hypothetical protein